jgi:hypothetical protein
VKNVTSKIATVIATGCLLAVPCLASNKGPDLTNEKFHTQKAKLQKPIKASKQEWVSLKLIPTVKSKERAQLKGNKSEKPLFETVEYKDGEK